MDFRIKQVWAQILALLPSVRVTLDKLPDLLENLFLISKMGILGSTSRTVIGIKCECSCKSGLPPVRCRGAAQ